jgi:anti-sigma regulatory factor (Ser/Thr protein kinase)
MVVLQREPAQSDSPNGKVIGKLLIEFEVPSAQGNERMALERVAATVAPLGLAPARLRRLETAVAEATMNAMEHGNSYRADRPVTVRVHSEPDRVRVEVADLGGARPAPGETEVPDLEAKLAGLQRPRGWGLFLIKNMVDEARETSAGERHIVELVMHLEPVLEEGDDDDDT